MAPRYFDILSCMHVLVPSELYNVTHLVIKRYTDAILHYLAMNSEYDKPFHSNGCQGPHFWDECPYPPRGACTAPPNGDFDGYVGLFDKGASQIQANPKMITGEASSNTFTGVYTFVRYGCLHLA